MPSQPGSVAVVSSSVPECECVLRDDIAAETISHDFV